MSDNNETATVSPIRYGSLLDPDEALILARTYAEAKGVTLRTVSKYIFGGGNDKTFVRLADGSGITSTSLARITKWFAANWPQDVAFPENVRDPATLAKTGARTRIRQRQSQPSRDIRTSQDTTREDIREIKERLSVLEMGYANLLSRINRIEK